MLAAPVARWNGKTNGVARRRPSAQRQPCARRRPPVVLESRVVQGSGGGPDKTILNSPRFLEPHYRTLCAYMHPPGDPGFEQIRRKADAWRAPLISVPDRGPWDWHVVLQCLDICRRERVAIWHGHDYKSNALGLFVRRFWPMKLVTTVHGWVHHTRRTPLYYRVDRFCLPRYDQVICVSQDLYEECLAAKVPPEKCVLVDNAIDTVESRRRRAIASAKEKLGVAGNRLVVGAVGRLSPEKGFDLLIAAVDRLLHAGSDLELWIVGEGSERGNLQAQIDRLGRNDRIRLLGFRADVRDLYEAMDVFALSSLREGLPNVVLEALALEVPVVATRVAGVPRLVRDGHCGWLVPPGSVEALASALERLCSDAALRQRFAQAGRAAVEENFSFAARMQRIRAIYDSLLCDGQ